MLHSNVKESTLFRSRSRFQGTIIQDLKIWLTVLLATMEGARQRQARAHRHRRYLADKERHSSMGRRFEEVQAELAALRQARGFFFSSAGQGNSSPRLRRPALLYTPPTSVQPRLSILRH